MAEVEHILEIHNVIGEGPIWHSQEGFLYWVNFIGEFQILRYSPRTQQLDVFATPMPVMALGIRKAGGFLAATAKGIATWDTKRKTFEPVCDPLAGRMGFRFNDAATDFEGRFWVGTLNDANPKGPDGELFRIQGDGACQLMDKNITVANGIGWSPDRTVMYFIDSFRYSIYAYDYAAATGTISNRRTFVQTSPEGGIPDGLTVDSEGFVWSAYCGGWRVVRYNPEGKVDREYRFPVANPTSCAFGGEHMDELYITSANLGLSENEKEKYPQSGDLFRLKVGVPGIDEPRFAG
ncbi:MAG TPA: SMP-30/gluconolactonase/LRE family protein [Terriglobales bacterium]|nr:SMP-30/gluconolactonase/LRE family protein [Terriglobales bacterium]